MILVQTPLRKSWEWETSTRILLYLGTSKIWTEIHLFSIMSHQNVDYLFLFVAYVQINSLTGLFCQVLLLSSWNPPSHTSYHSHLFSSSSSQTQASRSRWLVGSSNRSSVGRTNRARARDIRIRQPPEKSLHNFFCILPVKPVWAPSKTCYVGLPSKKPSILWVVDPMYQQNLCTEG